MAIAQGAAGLVQKAYYVDTGPSNVAIGIIDGGEYTEERPLEQVRGIGNTGAMDFGLYAPKIHVTGIPTSDTKALLNSYGLRTDYDAGLPPTVGTLPGVVAGNTSEYLTLDTNPRIDAWSLEFDAETMRPKFDLTFGACGATLTGSAVGSVTPGSSAPYSRGFGSCTIDGSAYKLKTIKLDVDNRIKRMASGDAMSSGERGWPDVETSEGELVKVSIELYQRYSVDLSADSPDTDIDIVLVLTDRSSNSWTFTISNLAATSFNRALDPTGQVVYAYDLEAQENLSTALVLT